QILRYLCVHTSTRVEVEVEVECVWPVRGRTCRKDAASEGRKIWQTYVDRRRQAKSEAALKSK
ncbi:hypothetical protein M5D96_006803, partial [Drosophila gunungcola]